MIWNYPILHRAKPKGNVFGVMWDYSQPSPKLTRLTPSNDPNHLVTVAITEEPVAEDSETTGHSPFDNYSPWKDMVKYNVEADGTLIRDGEAGFSLTKDTVVSIVDWYFYADHTHVDKQKVYYYAADKQVSSKMYKHPSSGAYVGRYETSGTNENTQASVTNSQHLGSRTLDELRSGVALKGHGWQQNDFAAWCGYCMLYLIEYANWDSQATIGTGATNRSVKPGLNSGKTDTMKYHTGSAGDKTTGMNSVQYRNIENPFGNVYEFLDGINIYRNIIYVCTDPDKYQSETTDGYTEIGKFEQNASGYSIKSLGVPTGEKNSWCFFPKDIGEKDGSDSYIPDFVSTETYTDWNLICVSGSYAGELESPYDHGSGLFSFSTRLSGLFATNMCGRLLYRKPE